MKNSVIFIAMIAGLFGLAACSSNSGPVPSCTFESASATLPEKIWQQFETQFADNSPSVSNSFLQTTRRHFKLQLGEITTVDTEKDTNQTNCTVVVTTALQDDFKDDTSQLSLDGKNLVGTVKYRVKLSDYQKTSSIVSMEIDSNLGQLARIGRAISDKELEATAQ